ncbi:MAG: DUF362 domain-containing protein [Chlorobi bacterium]|nr:DUF362 domain-containing protein [Chlorobiota bacterium]
MKKKRFYSFMKLKPGDDDKCIRLGYPKRLEGLVTWMRNHKIKGRVMFVLLGVASTVWFLIRVIPKPSRAAYPCMKVAAPMMSSFVLWLMAATTSVLSFKRFNSLLKDRKVYTAFLFLFVALTTGIISIVVNNQKTAASDLSLTTTTFVSNSPVGTATGLHPGRVVWVWNPDATNENMTNTSGDYWYQNGNADQQVIDSMLTRGICDLAGVPKNTAVAWDSLFTWFNRKRGIDRGYEDGEIVAVKLNLTNSVHPASYSDMYGPTEYPEYMDNTPEVVLALLKQLVDVCKIPQNNIYIGDNYRAFRDTYWDICHAEFPDVHYIDGIGEEGREKTKKSATEVLHFSDGTVDVCLPQHYLDATYLINLAALKTHNSAGITLTAKNHQGSIIKIDDDVSGTMNVGYAHESLPDAVPDYGSYRHLVDYMGHKDLGGKTFLYMIDGIWSGREFWGKIYKWDMPPFDGDYPSSIFLSQDPVAIESVGFDFLLAEFSDKPDEDKLPYMAGVDDYLYQAADNSYWPDGINYDPEGDGTAISSLGVYEHWNNETDKEYTRNLGTGSGIELIKTFLNGPSTGIKNIGVAGSGRLLFYPNPVYGDFFTVEMSNKWRGEVNYTIVNMTGQTVSSGRFIKNDKDVSVNIPAASLTPGVYVVRCISGNEQVTGKIKKN